MALKNLVNIGQQEVCKYKQSYLAGHSPLIKILDLELRQKLPRIFACLLITHTYINGATDNLELVVRMRNMFEFDGFSVF